MYIYLITLIVSLLFAKLASNARPYPALKGTVRTYAICSFLPFALNCMLRGQVGTDWLIYDAYYAEISNGGRRFSEPLFNLLNRILYMISNNSLLLFAVVGFITLALFFAGMYQQSAMVTYSILLFFLSGKYFASLNQIRQMLAMSLFFFAFKYIRERKMIRYFLFILAACLIHTSAVVYIPLYFLYGIRCSTKRLFKAALVYCVCLPVIILMAPVLVKLTRFSWYLDSRFSQNFDIIGFTLSLIIFGLLLFLLRRQEMQAEGTTGENAEDLRYAGFLTMISMITCLVYFLTNAVPQVTRIAECYSVIQILSLPYLAKGEKDARIRIAVLVFTAAVLGCKLLYNVYSTHWWYGVLPYHTFFYPG